ncbi:MAG TPA: rhodanese-like domain-containing protein, partial [Nitrososphaeraceae archaeon]|nr:rhodanese-like domain-containing protein [Nitrososphaeraceae archaeon]
FFGRLRRRGAIAGVTIQFITISTFILALSIAYHTCSEIGFMNNQIAIAEVTRRYNIVNFDELNKSEMETLVEEGSVLLVDSRMTADFAAASIPGAVSLPVTSSLAQRISALAGVAKTRQIVVFCQSSQCKFSDEIAHFLKFNGYRNVLIYRGGFLDWIKD